MLFVCRFLSKINFSKNSIRNNIRVEKNLHQDQAQHFLRFTLGQNCSKWLLVVSKSGPRGIGGRGGGSQLPVNKA